MSRHGKIAVAVVGCGHAGRLHLSALRRVSDVEVVAIADKDGGRISRVGWQFGIASYATDYRAVLERAEVVAICVPPRQHCEIALDALDAGKHVFVEKPLAPDPRECKLLVGAAARSGKCATVGLNLRWHRLVRRATRLIAEGMLGEVVAMDTSFRSAWPAFSEDWRNRPELGGNILLEIGVHHFDLWRAMTGSEVGEISASYEGHGSGQTARVTATMANGTVVSSVFSNCGGIANKMEVQGTQGRLGFSCYDEMSFEVDLAKGRTRRWWRPGEAIKELPGLLWRTARGGAFIDSYCAAWRHFLNCVRAGRAPEPSFEDGKRAVDVSLAAMQSVGLGRPVSLRGSASGALKAGA